LRRKCRGGTPARPSDAEGEPHNPENRNASNKRGAAPAGGPEGRPYIYLN